MLQLKKKRGEKEEEFFLTSPLKNNAQTEFVDSDASIADLVNT